MILLHNAQIHTLDGQIPVVSALAIDGGRVVASGSDDEILESFGSARKGVKPTRYDLEGFTVIPGLVDAHLHLEHYALGLQKIDCELPTKAEVLYRVAERARNTPPGEWILGHGWNQNLWADGFGSAADLDAVAPDHPVYLTAKSLHAAWANSAALRKANITPSTPDPEGGRLGRDGTGTPNGILFESAMELVADAIPEPTIDTVARAIQDAQPALWRYGITGVHDFDRRRCFSALQILHARHDLHLRVLKSIPLDDLHYATGLGLRSGFGDEYLRIGGVKAFADGALGPQTAAMLQPYEGSLEDRGMLLLDAEELFERGREAVANGLSLAVHAIGDRANHEVLNAYEQLRKYEQELSLSQQGSRPHSLRHRVEHVQLIHPDDAGRLASLGVIASMQPVHATSDMQMANRFWGERSANAYAWRTQLSAGAVLAFGSDAPVESPNPFWGLHAAVTRQRADGLPGPDGWYPAQRLSFAEALYAFTTGPAFAAGLEAQQGRLAPGYLADLIVLDRSPFHLENPGMLREMLPTATMVGGEWVFQS